MYSVVFCLFFCDRYCGSVYTSPQYPESLDSCELELRLDEEFQMSRFMCGPKGWKLEYCRSRQEPPGSRLKGATWTGATGDTGDMGAERSAWNWLW